MSRMRRQPQRKKRQEILLSELQKQLQQQEVSGNPQIQGRNNKQTLKEL